MFWREGVLMRLFQEYFFIIRLVFSRKCGLFIWWRHWFGCFFPCTLIRWVIIRCFQRVIWGQLGRWIRQNFNIFLWRMDTFLFLCVFHCGFCILLIFRNLLLLIHTSVRFSLFLSFSWLFLCFPNLFLMLKIFLLFPHFIIITQYVFQPFLSLV